MSRLPFAHIRLPMSNALIIWACCALIGGSIAWRLTEGSTPQPGAAHLKPATPTGTRANVAPPAPGGPVPPVVGVSPSPAASSPAAGATAVLVTVTQSAAVTSSASSPGGGPAGTPTPTATTTGPPPTSTDGPTPHVVPPPTSTPPPKWPTAAPIQLGDPCENAGQPGLTVDRADAVCSTSATDPKLRWRSA